MSQMPGPTSEPMPPAVMACSASMRLREASSEMTSASSAAIESATSSNSA
jgi:hypothetical protein